MDAPNFDVIVFCYMGVKFGLPDLACFGVCCVVCGCACNACNLHSTLAVSLFLKTQNIKDSQTSGGTRQKLFLIGECVEVVIPIISIIRSRVFLPSYLWFTTKSCAGLTL